MKSSINCFTITSIYMILSIIFCDKGVSKNNFMDGGYT